MDFSVVIENLPGVAEVLTETSNKLPQPPHPLIEWASVIAAFAAVIAAGVSMWALVFQRQEWVEARRPYLWVPYSFLDQATGRFSPNVIEYKCTNSPAKVDELTIRCIRRVGSQEEALEIYQPEPSGFVIYPSGQVQRSFELSDNDWQSILQRM